MKFSALIVLALAAFSGSALASERVQVGVHFCHSVLTK